MVPPFFARRFIPLLCMFGGLSACIQEVHWETPEDETLVIALERSPQTFDPRFSIDSTSSKISRLLFRSLVSVSNGGLIPQFDLAEKAYPDPQNPALWHIHLQREQSFHDGTPLTGDDVAYTYNSVLDPELGSPFQGDFSTKFERVEVDAMDRFHLRFHLKRPYATFLTDLVLGVVPASLQDRPDQRFPVDQPVGSGPFVLHHHQPDRILILERADAAKSGKANWLQFRVIKDENTRILGLMGGTLDVVMNGVSPVLGEELTQHPQVHSVDRPGIGFTYLGVNLRHSILATPEVRQALSLSIDRNAIIQERFRGLAVPAAGMLPAFHWGYAPSSASQYDPIRAKTLLDEAGLVPDPITGNRLTLELKTSSDRFRLGIARAIARQWKTIGIELRIRSFEFSTFFADVRKGRFDLFLLQLPEPIEPDMYRWMLYSLSTPQKEAGAKGSAYGRMDRSLVPPGIETVQQDPLCKDWARTTWIQRSALWVRSFLGARTSTGSANRVYYANPSFDCRVELGQWETDREQRIVLYRQIQQILADDLPVIPLWHEHQRAYLSDRVAELNLLPFAGWTPVADAVLHSR